MNIYDLEQGLDMIQRSCKCPYRGSMHLVLWCQYIQPHRARGIFIAPLYGSFIVYVTEASHAVERMTLQDIKQLPGLCVGKHWVTGCIANMPVTLFSIMQADGVFG